MALQLHSLVNQHGVDPSSEQYPIPGIVGESVGDGEGGDVGGAVSGGVDGAGTQLPWAQLQFGSLVQGLFLWPSQGSCWRLRSTSTL